MVHSGSLSGVSITTTDLLDQERKIRCFWATWASICVAGIPKAIARNAWEEAANVILPIAPQEREMPSVVSIRQSMNEDWNCVSYNSDSSCQGEGKETSHLGELMKLMGIW